MPGRVKKIVVGVASFLIVGGLLFAANYFYQKTQIEQPMIDIISGIAGVEDLELSIEKGKLVVYVALAPNAEITTTWPQIVEAAAVVDDPNRFSIKIRESQELSAELVKASVALELAVQESLATGAYTAIPKVLAELEEVYGVNSQVSLSREQLLIELAVESDKLYQIVSLAQQDRG